MTKAGRVTLAAAWAVASLCQPAFAQWYGRPYPYPYYPPGYYPYPAPPPYYARPPEVPAPPRPSAAIAEVQRDLASLGYDPGPLDGLFGPRVAEAVSGFQRDHGLTVNGQLSGVTIGAIHEAARSGASQGAPIPQPSSDAGAAAAPTSRPTLSVRPTTP